MDLDAAIDELYAISPDDFVERRKALATEARQQKERELAKQIASLRRPTRSAWLVNVLARESADQLSALLDLGAELAEAQQRGSGPDLRRLSQQRRKAVDALAGQAVKLGRDLGYAAPDGALQEVAQTLQAALGEPEVAELVRRGRLTQATTYGGFGPSDLTAALAGSMPTAAARLAAPHAAPEAEDQSAAEEPEPTAESAEDRERREQAEQAAAEARAAADEAQAELEQAEADSEAATTRADELADEVDTLRSRLRETEAAEREAREQARTLRKRQTELRQAAVAAEKRASDAAAAVPG
jgi:hypothetical protein